jgi:hypothetical protein
VPHQEVMGLIILRRPVSETKHDAPFQRDYANPTALFRKRRLASSLTMNPGERQSLQAETDFAFWRHKRSIFLPPCLAFRDSCSTVENEGTLVSARPGDSKRSRPPYNTGTRRRTPAKTR